MAEIKFSELDSTGKRTVWRIAEEADTQTPIITAAASHVGELWAAAAFMQKFAKGTAEHQILSERLRLGNKSVENIFDCIRRALPNGVTLDNVLDEYFSVSQESRWLAVSH